MEILTSSDTQRLHHSIQKIYALRNLDTFGVDALLILNQLVPGDFINFHSSCMKTRQIRSTFLPDCPGWGSEIERVIHQHFYEHPLTQRMPQALTGVNKISDFINQQELYRLEGLYQQFFRLFDFKDQMVFFLPNANLDSSYKSIQMNAPLLGFSFHRSQPNFTERDRLILDLLCPHLFQAYCNALHCQQLQQELNQLQQSLDHLGLVILDTEGHVQRVTPQAIVWLETYFSKPTTSLQLPDHLWSWVKHQINHLPAKTDPPKARLPLRIQQNDKHLVIRLIIEQNAERYLLLLEEHTLSLSTSLELLGLSQRETEVLFWVMQGNDNKMIATQLGIGPSTVRKHLERIYQKLGVQSRTEAIAHTLNKLGFLHTLPITSTLD